jgi:hypothetical protein
MKTWSLATTYIAVALLAALTAGCHRAGSPSANAKSGALANNGVPTVSDIMQKVNKRKGGLHSAVGEALKADPVDWPAVQKETKEYAALAEFLGKNDPPQGDKASWESLTKEYAESARALHAAAEKQNKAAALEVHGRISKSCMTCHRSHKP